MTELKARKILIVVDMQNDFIDGALGTEEAVGIVSKVAKKIEEYRTSGHEIVFTRDTHYDNYLETQEGRNLPVKHCIYGTEGWEISSELKTESSEIINKNTFGSIELVELVGKKYSLAEIELIGLCTDICVISNAIMLKAAFPENRISVDATCCAGVTPQSHENALEAMKMCQIEIIR